MADESNSTFVPHNFIRYLNCSQAIEAIEASRVKCTVKRTVRFPIGFRRISRVRDHGQIQDNHREGFDNLSENNRKVTHFVRWELVRESAALITPQPILSHLNTKAQGKLNTKPSFFPKIKRLEGRMDDTLVHNQRR